MLDLIINADQLRDDAPVVRLGLSIAARNAAFVTGVQIVASYPPIMMSPAAAGLIESHEREARARSIWWHELCDRRDLRGEWEVLCGDPVMVLAKRSRLADFIVSALPVDAPDAPIGFDNITRTLFADASPMLLVPDSWAGSASPDSILIAWNGSGEAADAIRAALPLLRSARSVRVLDGEIDGLPGVSPPPLPLRQWLSRHGVEVQWQQFNPSGQEAGKALLQEARDMGADLLVMGAWGRSRLSELVLGGATRHVLEHTHLPLLLAH